MSDDANGLTKGVGKLLGDAGNGLAVGLVGPAGVVADDGDALGEVNLQGIGVGLACRLR